MPDGRWLKKFSLGLVLDTDLPAFEQFLADYSPWIDNFYFSLPMGDRFHARARVAEQLRSRETVAQFWEQLRLIRRYGIGLEVLFNTRDLTEADVREGRALLDAHGLEPDKVGLTDAVWDAVARSFPGKETVWSFNNFPACREDYGASGHPYAEYVAGRQFIRDRALFDRIHQQLKGRVVLLVNNGCSHLCGGCSTRRHCLEAHQRGLQRHSAEYLYALQSIMPFELHEGLLDLKQIDLIKINSRNTDIGYLRRCLQSYLEGDEARYLAESRENYALWGHLTWHMRAFGSFDLARIRAIKEALYEGREIPDQPGPPYVRVMADWCNRFIFRGSPDRAPAAADRQRLEAFCREVGGALCGCCVGAEGCPHLLAQIEPTALAALIRGLRAERTPVFLSIPRGCAPAAAEALLRALQAEGARPDGLLLRDEAALEAFRGGPWPLLAGPELWELARREGGLPGDVRAVVDFQEPSLPRHLCNSGTVARTPLTCAGEGLCCLKPEADRAGRCEGAPCLKQTGRILRGRVPGLRRMTLRGDQLYRLTPPDEQTFLMTQTWGMTLLYTPEEGDAP